MSGVFDSRGSRLYRPVLFYNVSFPWHKNHEKGDKENCGRCRFPADHGQKQTVETAGSRKPEVHPVGNGGVLSVVPSLRCRSASGRTHKYGGFRWHSDFLVLRSQFSFISTAKSDAISSHTPLSMSLCII